MTSQTDVSSCCNCVPLSDMPPTEALSSSSLNSGATAHNDETFASFPSRKDKRRTKTTLKSTMTLLAVTLASCFLLLLEQPVVDAFSSGSSTTAVASRSSIILLQVASITPDGDEPTASETVSKAAQKMVVEATNAAAGKTSGSKKAEKQQNYAAMVDFDWQPIAELVFTEEDSRPIILFDGVCNLCNGGVNFAMDHDSQAKFRFASLQSTVAQSLLLREGKHPTKTQNIVLVTPKKAYYASHAVAKICSKLDAPLLQLAGNVGQTLPKALREPLYKLVSENRFVLGENDSCRLDLDGEYTSRFVSDPTVVGEISNNE